MKKLNKQVQWWHWAGKVLPMIALMVLCLVIVFDLTKIRDIVVCSIAVAFGAVAFTWWWWVMGAVKALTDLLTSAQTRFGEVLTEIKDLRKDMNDKNKKK